VTCDKCSLQVANVRTLAYHHARGCKGTYACDKCPKEFGTKQHRDRHRKSACKYSCESCSRTFSTEAAQKQHNCGIRGAYKCHKCSWDFTSAGALTQHIVQNHKSHTCRTCKQSFVSKSALCTHQDSHVGEIQDTPWSDADAPWKEGDGFQQLYESNKRHIRAKHAHKQINSTYNFPTSDLAGGVREINDHLSQVYAEQKEAFKANIALGLVLRHSETGEFRYFVPYNNVTLFDQPTVISKPSDMEKLKQRILKLSMDHMVRDVRPDTKWSLHFITNINVYVFRMGYALGRGVLPAHLKRCRTLIGLEADQFHKLYDDQLCAFRCLAYHRNQFKNIERDTVALYRQWRDFLIEHESVEIPENAYQYGGLDMELFPIFEQCFELNLWVVQRDAEKCVRNAFKSSARGFENIYKDTLHLNLHENHLSYITNFKAFALKFQCTMCDRVFGHQATIESM